MAAPVININTAGAKGLTSIDDATAATNWGGFKISGGATPAAAAETDILDTLVANAISTKLSGSGTDKGIWADNLSGIDMTVSGRHLYIWVCVTTPAICNLITANGIYIIASTSGAIATDYVAFNVGGDAFTEVGWNRYVIDLNKTPSRSAGSTNLASVQYFGAGISILGTVKSENLIVGRVDYGDGLQIEAGDATDPATWAALADDDLSNGYGVVLRQPNGDFGIQGGITIGDPAGTVTTLWSEQSGAKVAFTNPVYHNGSALVSSIDAANLYQLEVLGNGTGTTDVDFGSVVGSGDDRQGINGGTIGTAGPKWSWDSETDIADLDTVNFFGVTFQGASIVAFSSSTKTDVIGCGFSECDEVQPNTAEFLNNAIIAPQPDRGMEMVASHNIKQITFVAGGTADRPADRVWQVDATGPSFVEYTAEFNSATANDVLAFPATEASGDYIAFGSRQKFGKLRVNTGTAGAGGTPAVTWEYWSGSAWTALGGVTDGTTAFTVTGLQDVTYTVPTDWAATSLIDEDPRFYLRARLTSVYSTTNPLITQGFVADPIEHHLHVPATGTYDVEKLNFFGFGAAGAPKWMGENSSAGLVTLDVTDSSPSITDAETDETGGGSTTVNNNVQVTLTGMKDNTEVRVYSQADPPVELAGIEDVTAGTADDRSFAFSLAAAITVDIRILMGATAAADGLHYKNTDIEDFIIPGSAASVPVQQQLDRDYLNP